MSSSARIVSVRAPLPGALDPDGDTVAQVLDAAGIPVVARILVEDDDAALEAVLGSAGAVTVILAGHGGSAGDVVRRVVARRTELRLVLNDRMLAALEEHYRRHQRPLPRRAERLALLPQGAAVWTDDESEPGWGLVHPGGSYAVLPRGGRLGPGLVGALGTFVRERLGGRPAALTRTLKTAGVSLADVEERLVDWLGRDGPVGVVTVPAAGEVWVRLSQRAAVTPEAGDALTAVEAAVLDALGEDCYGRDGDTLESVVGRALLERRLTLAVAESCTGGLVGHRLTNVPGASGYFERGVIVYSNRAKQDLLGVPEAVLREHGAVSAPCAEAMARGVAEVAGSDCGLAVTGIAGPDGGTPTKPVGTVFIGLAVGGEAVSRRFRFAGDRAAVKWQSAQMALDMLRRRLGGLDA